MAEVVELVVVVIELALAVISVGKRLYEVFQDGPKELAGHSPGDCESQGPA